MLQGVSGIFTKKDTSNPFDLQAYIELSFRPTPIASYAPIVEFIMASRFHSCVILEWKMNWFPPCLDISQKCSGAIAPA